MTHDGGWHDMEAIESERFEADMQMADFEREGRRLAKIQGKPGLCEHGWSGPSEVKDGTFKCYHNCGKVWASREARDADNHFVS